VAHAKKVVQKYEKYSLNDQFRERFLELDNKVLVSHSNSKFNRN
jgi:hypothetical protein